MNPGYAGSNPFAAALSTRPSSSSNDRPVLGGDAATRASTSSRSPRSAFGAVYRSSTKRAAKSTALPPSSTSSSSGGSNGERPSPCTVSPIRAAYAAPSDAFGQLGVLVQSTGSRHGLPCVGFTARNGYYM